MKRNYAALVVGAGIGGIRAALDLAETGQKVALIDKRRNLGGFLGQLDHQFPSDHCGMCKMLPLTERDSSSQFCMRKGLFHRNIDIHLSTELTALEGDPGSYQAVLTRSSPLVDPHKCMGCGECARVCPVRVKSEFNAGLTMRAAVHLPTPHAIPNGYVIDLDNCVRCWRCHEACPSGAIDFKFEERKDFGIIVADPEKKTGESLAGWLSEHNFPLHAASTGEKAIDLLAEGGIRMMLLSPDVKDMEPERVLMRALEINPELYVVVLGREEQREIGNELIAKGAREFLDKPLDSKTLVPWLDKLYLRIVSEERIEIETAAVILAAGFDCYDPADDPNGVRDVLQYGEHPCVVTSLEFERMCSGSGPTAGELSRPSDSGPLKKIAWLQCVGSRNLKSKADYCSSICCMISLKEANLARKLTMGQEGGPAEGTIFYMDMRTYGKGFEDYRQKAEKEGGLRLIRSRIHSVTPDPAANGAGILVQYLDDKGVLQEEGFDLLVLAVGARPPAKAEKLAEAAGIELNEWGFCRTSPFEPARSSQIGVFAAGCFAGGKDISESVIQSSAAALGASRLINIYAPLRERTPEPEPEYRDVSRQAPNLMVALCHSCPILEREIDLEGLKDKLMEINSVGRVVMIERACSQKGWEEVIEACGEEGPNRILIGACMPYSYIPKLRELGMTIKLNPALMDVADIYSPLFASEQEKDKDEVEKEIFSRLNMAAVRLMGADPSPLPPPMPVTRSALVVGGGLAGMTAALGMADHGYETVLVEKEEELGGWAVKLHSTLEGEDPAKFMEDMVEQVEKHPNIKVHKDSRVSLSMGKAGGFMSVVAGEGGGRLVQHGVTILATGGHESKVYDYGFRVHKNVLTQLELESRLADGSLDTGELGGVAMIQCWRSREEDRNYCSRVCCSWAMKNILELKKRNPDLPIYVFYRDIMTYGFSESYYTKARQAGAIFIRYEPENKPKVGFEDGKPVVTATEPILGREIKIKADLLVLSSGIEPNDSGEIEEIFGVEADEYGFLKEAESKWRPVDFLKQGIFVCGLARAPGNMSETILSAKAAAQRAIRILSEKRLTCGNVVAEVRHSLCSLCGRCIEVCPYGARRMDMQKDKIVVDELLCQGCGSCAAICPNSASLLRGYGDGQVMSMIDAALQETS